MRLPGSRPVVWCIWFVVVFVAAFVLSGMQPPPLELDPSWHAALEYAALHHLQFGTQVVFTFGPLGFLDTRTSLGHLVAARVAFAFFWSVIVAMAAATTALRLPGWLRYAFLGWLVVFTLSEGLDQTAFFVMAYGALLLLADDRKLRWQAPLVLAAFVVLSLIKSSFFTAATASLTLVAIGWLWQRKPRSVLALAIVTPAAFVASWAALGQSPAHLATWLRYTLELEAGYSAAMNLVPKPPVLWAGGAALALFVIAFCVSALRVRRTLPAWLGLLTVAQYAFFAWKEGLTRSGDWHTYVFLWFLPLAWALLFLEPIANTPSRAQRWVTDSTFAAGMALCLAAAQFQIAGFAWKQVAQSPWRVYGRLGMITAASTEHAGDLYAVCRDPQNFRMMTLDRARDVIGNQSVDVMNYLLLAPIVNALNYQPRPVIQGFVAYTPALQRLNEDYFKSSARPKYVLLSQQATDGRYPTLEDSAALNFVLNNYVPVARDGQFLVLQQRTAEEPAFQLAHEQTVHFGDVVDLRPWSHQPLFMSVNITPTWKGRLAALLYQPQPLYLRVEREQREERYRIVPSMAENPFLVNPLLASDYDVFNLYTSHPDRENESITFEPPQRAAGEFEPTFTVRLYTASGFLRAREGIPIPRIIADVQGRAFWPEPVSVDSAVPERVMIFHGSPALLVRAPSKIVVEVPEQASAFTGYYGVPALANAAGKPVEVSITVEDASGTSRPAFERTLQPGMEATGRDRLSFTIPLDPSRDRTITLTTRAGDSADAEGGWSVWSQCRIETSNTPDHQ